MYGSHDMRHTVFRRLMVVNGTPRDLGRYNSNIKCVNSTIKYTCFKLFYYVINPDIVSSFMIFSRSDSMFLSMYY